MYESHFQNIYPYYCTYIILALVGYWLQADRVPINALENTANIIKKQIFLTSNHIFLNKPKKRNPRPGIFFPATLQ